MRGTLYESTNGERTWHRSLPPRVFCVVFWKCWENMGKPNNIHSWMIMFPMFLVFFPIVWHQFPLSVQPQVPCFTVAFGSLPLLEKYSCTWQSRASPFFKGRHGMTTVLMLWTSRKSDVLLMKSDEIWWNPGVLLMKSDENPGAPKLRWFHQAPFFRAAHQTPVLACRFCPLLCKSSALPRMDLFMKVASKTQPGWMGLDAQRYATNRNN